MRITRTIFIAVWLLAAAVSAFIPYACSAASLASAGAVEDPRYCWLQKYDPSRSIEKTIPVPVGYERAPLEKGSFGEWLRGLQLFEGRPAVLLYNGSPKVNQSAHFAVIDIDCGDRDLQQCADAVMRLRAEYLRSSGRAEEIAFLLTCGKEFSYKKWREGFYPVFISNKLNWRKRKTAASSYGDFRKYLDYVFMYANTYSLSLQMKSAAAAEKLNSGDVFIKGGFPGHAVIVVDVAKNPKNGKLIFLIAQSYMPAQQMHILVNPSDPAISPWYESDFGDVLRTPEWDFEKNQLKRF